MQWSQIKAQRRPLAAAIAATILLVGVAALALRRTPELPPASLLEPAPTMLREGEPNLEITVPDVPEAKDWLQAYLAQREAAASSPRPPPERPSMWRQAVKLLTTVCGLPIGSAVEPHRYLLLATVGDQWNTSNWLSQPKHATFDVAAIYYGTNEGFVCEACSDVFRMRGPKWYLYYNITTSPEWEAMVARGYKYIMLPDDDLIMDTCQLNTFFSVMEEFDALMGQPSVCEREGSYTWWPMLYQHAQHRVRFTTFMEIMAPTFRTDMYQALVRHTMKGTYTGYGLDLVWPALLKYPDDKIAVVDQICMVHPPSPPGGKPGGLYDVTNSLKTTDGNEMDQVLEHFNYKPEVVERMGQEYRAMKNLKSVDSEAALQAVANLESHLHRDAFYQVLVVVQGGALVMLVGMMGAARLRKMLRATSSGMVRLGSGMLRSGSQEWKLPAWRAKYSYN